MIIAVTEKGRRAMNDMRERLVELIENAEDQRVRMISCCTVDEFIDIPIREEYVADYLIANGVTVQEWISVDDRLPKPFTYALVQMPGETPHQTVREGFISRDGVWHSALYDREPDEVTHWMPLPQPPKGE